MPKSENKRDISEREKEQYNREINKILAEKNRKYK